jgi:hypothetical protein
MTKIWQSSGKNWNLETPMAKAEEINKLKRSIKFKVKDGHIRRVIEIPKRSEIHKRIEIPKRSEIHKRSETEGAVRNLLEKELRDENLERNDLSEIEQTRSPQKLLHIPAPKQKYDKKINKERRRSMNATPKLF